ncbi:MAG: NUDIX hydrolase [Microthrixaceae bacterium]
MWYFAGDAGLAQSADRADVLRTLDSLETGQLPGHDRCLDGTGPSGVDASVWRDKVRAAVVSEPAVAERTTRPGHLTGSALVVDESGERLVVLFHRKLQRWLQPGGHADGDHRLASVALREAAEETGLGRLAVWSRPIDVDVHRVTPPGEDGHDHFDVRFLVLAPEGGRLRGNHESEEIRWIGFDQLDSIDADVSLRRLVAGGRATFDRLSAAGRLPRVCRS